MLARFSASAFRPLVAARHYSKITSSALEIEKTKTPRERKLENIKFGTEFSDHMLVIDFDEKQKDGGWGAPKIIPYGDMKLSPSITALHYAVQCFEGMKAYKDNGGKVRLFRPEMNMQRLNKSGKRLCLPEIDEGELLECIKQLVRLDRDWVPQIGGHSLYIRPTYIGTTPALGVGPSGMARLFVITGPVGPYYPTGFKPISILAETEYVRAWRGGSGDSKLGANYGPTIIAQVRAAKRNFQQVLWLVDDVVTEVGTMNQFFFLKNESGEDELVTCPLDGSILPGVTRDSVLALCRKWNEFKVSERKFTMTEIAAAIKSGRLYEAFGAGTAAVVAPVSLVEYKGESLPVPIDPQMGCGKLSKRIWSSLLDIQYGNVEHPWSVRIE